MADNGPYFVMKSSGSVFLGVDGTWYNKKTIVDNPSILCKFAALEEAQSTARLKYKKGCATQVCGAKKVKKALGVDNSYWEYCLFRMHDGLLAQDNSESCDLQMKPDMEADGLPEDTLSDDSPNAVNAVSASEAVSAELNDTELIMDTVDVLIKLQRLSKQWEDATLTNGDKIKEVEKAIQDELHFVEFMKLDMQRAYRSYKRLHDLRVRRRQLKNELVVVDKACLALHTTPKPLFDNVTQALSCIGGLKDRKYKPRVSWPTEDDTFNFQEEE